MGVAAFIYTTAFKESTMQIRNYRLSSVMLAAGIVLLFIFLNIELYHIVNLFNSGATKFATTLLWVLFGIALFIGGVIRAIQEAKISGTVLIFIAIAKAFFFDLANLDALFRIILFLILGAILFGLSYFYQRKKDSE